MEIEIGTKLFKIISLFIINSAMVFLIYLDILTEHQNGLCLATMFFGSVAIIYGDSIIKFVRDFFEV